MTALRTGVAPETDTEPARVLPAYSVERQRQARQLENFPIAAWLLRPGRREARGAIYGFCRLIDDLGDENLGDPKTLLGLAREELDACYAGQPHHPVFQRLQPVIQRFQLAPEPFQRLIQANLQDQELSHYRSWAELDQYCTLSATPVGELVLALEGIRDPERVGYSDAICTGLQLANMWQDVASDLARGRRYLPLDVLVEHGATEEEWWSGAVTPGMLAAETHAVARARRLLIDGWPLVGRVPNLMRLEMATFILCGLAATAAVLEAGARVFAEKAVLSPARRRRAVWQAGWAWRQAAPPRSS
ncbi:MAG TPA: squalene/phytoene synthase family protein [Candidatus Dormibacteraeota bacterium]|nr:squalene/phytoene synthase family protein [Candidatus Dormibacteraeota bacterium]